MRASYRKNVRTIDPLYPFEKASQLGGNGELEVIRVKQLAFRSVEKFDAYGFVGVVITNNYTAGFGDGMGGKPIPEDKYQNVCFGIILNVHQISSGRLDRAI